MQWFDVDKAGLAKLLERKGKPFVLHELVQNAWDENTTNVWVKVKRIANSPFVSLRVSDDNPDGFADLSHAFTLFAESNKKANAAKRGRFNLGEKLVLALCRKAEISSTRGTVIFDETGRHRSSRATERGSVFTGELKMTDTEMAECRAAMELLISPEGITTYYEIGDAPGVDLPMHPCVAEFEEPMTTETANADGVIIRTTRKTRITIHTSKGQAYLYEMGIPVVEIDGRYHVNVHQKVPLNFDRDNVTPAYLAKAHALTVEHMKDKLTTDDVNKAWVKIAVQENGDELSVDVVRKIADLRFGELRVAYDPSDREASNIAVSKGYQVVHGGNLSGAEWKTFQRAGAILPAGQVTPSRPDATVPVVTVPRSEWTPGMLRVANYCIALAPLLIDVTVLTVLIYNNSNVGEIATYERQGPSKGTISFNMGRLGRDWFDGLLVKINALIIHEFAHQFSSNHLSEEYYDALTEIGAKLSVVALGMPELFGMVSPLVSDLVGALRSAKKHIEDFYPAGEPIYFVIDSALAKATGSWKEPVNGN